MSNFTQTLSILFAFALVSIFSNAAASRPPPVSQVSTPENSQACNTLMFKMTDCLPYLKNESSVAEPGNSCCSGFSDIGKVNDPSCVNYVVQRILELRNDMNETRVAHVSSVCGFTDIPLDKYLENSFSEARSPSDTAAVDMILIFPILVVVLLILAGLICRHCYMAARAACCHTR